MKKRSLALLLCAVLLMSLCFSACTAAPQALDMDLSGQIVILHTNDTHGFDVAGEEALGMASVAQLKKDYEAQGAYVLLLDAGDFSQGQPLVNMSKGAVAVDFMNAAGYDAVCLGNHEFDNGIDVLRENLSSASFSVLAANVLYNGAPAFDTNKVFEAPDGTKIGIFGLDTPSAATDANPAKNKGMTFLAGEELYKCAAEQVDALKAEGCTFIICLGHLGVETVSGVNSSKALLKNVDGIDLFIDGHSHTVLNGNAAENKINGAMLVSTGCYFANIGVVVDNGGKLTASLLTASDYSKTDSKTAEVVNAVDADVQQQLSAFFCKNEVTLNGETAPGVRTMETNLGDLSCDAVLWAVRQMTDKDVDCAFLNGGGIRMSIPVGDVTLSDIKSVFPFNNTICTATLTGEQLLQYLAMSTAITPEPMGPFPQAAGLEYTVNTGVEYKPGEDYGTFRLCENADERISDVTVNGKPLDPKASYTVATNDFIAAGGGSGYVFTLVPHTDTGIFLEDALSAYVDSELGGVIGQQYKDSQGRIEVFAGKPSAAA